MKIKVGLISLGCPKNLVDSEIVLSNLSTQGFKIVRNPKEADIIIINTCCFIKPAKDEARGTIKEMGLIKTEGICKGIIVTGCYSERYKSKIFEEFPFVDGIIGTGELERIPSAIVEILKGDRIKYFGEVGYARSNINRHLISTPSYTAYIKIAEGCDNRCSYCIIPSIKGDYRSRKLQDITSEAKLLAGKGVKELILIAQDTTRYGLDIYHKKSLSQLLRELSGIKSIKWIRFLYAYPDEIDDELINTVKDNDKIVKYFDIPIQHVSNRILKNMKRRGCSEDLNNLFSKLRQNIPDVVLRTSVIVGFPDERDEDYSRLKSFVLTTKFDRLGVFKYSEEEGTSAFNLSNKISEKIKEKRFNEIMKAQQLISKKINKKLMGQKFDALIEKEVRDNLFIGRTYRDVPDIDGLVYVKSDNKLKIGDFAKIQITGYSEYDLEGRVNPKP